MSVHIENGVRVIRRLRQSWDGPNRVCTSCWQEKPIEEFRSRGKRNGRHSHCNSCQYDKLQKWCAENKHRRRETREKSRRKNVVAGILRNARYRARKLGIPFSIEREDIFVPEFCPILGLKMGVGKMHERNSSPSIDRIDPDLGYVKGNVHVISYRANWLKHRATLSDLRKMVAYLEAREAAK